MQVKSSVNRDRIFTDRVDLFWAKGLLGLAIDFASRTTVGIVIQLVHMKKIVNSEFFLPICFLSGFLLGEIIIWIFK